MRQSNLFTLGILFVLSIGIAFTIEWANDHSYEMEGCKRTDQIRATSGYVFTYCKDNDKVLDTRDSTWMSPSKYQNRWIETKKIN